MKKEYLSKIKEELSKYQNIPKDLYNYIENVFKKDSQEHLLPVITIGKERKIVLENINNLFKKASDITKLSPVDIIKALDFHSKDTSLGRIDAAFAELSTIIFLSKFNLYNIIPLKAEKNEKSADFIAMGDSDKYAIEVFCKISQSQPQTIKEIKKNIETNKLMREPLTYGDDLFRYFIDKSIPKKTQLDNTAKKYECDKKIIVIVLNDTNISFFLTIDNCHNKCLKILNKISTELKWGSKYYFAIVIGSFNIVYPPITP